MQTKSRRTKWIPCLFISLGAGLAEGQETKNIKESISDTVSDVTAVVSRKHTTPEGTVLSAIGEVVATNFIVQPGACVRADSSLDFADASNVSITLLTSDEADISDTRILPFFAVAKDALYVPAASIINAADFYFSDGGGATVPVHGRYLRMYICNEGRDSITHAQIIARGSGR